MPGLLRFSTGMRCLPRLLWCIERTPSPCATAPFVHVDTVLLRRIYALLAVEHGSRRTHLVGVSAHPTGAWTTQAAGTLIMDLADRVTTITFVLRDRDSRFTRTFDAVFTADGIRILTRLHQSTRGTPGERDLRTHDGNVAPRATRQGSDRE